MLDAYSVRKAVPRILLAVILINLSIYLCVGALDLTNVIGKGLNDLLVTPFVKDDSFKQIGVQANAGNTILGVLGAGGALAGAVGAVVVTVATGGAAIVAVLGAIFPLIITIACITFAVLFTLVIRQGLLVFLIVVSPVAFACYVLPGTEKYFKQWLDLFTKTLMVYPIIAAIFAMSNVLGAILLSSGATPAAIYDPFTTLAQAATTTGNAGLVQLIATIIVLYAPLVLIPFAFKFAGGAIGAVMNAANGRAASMGGRFNQKWQKNRENPNSFVGSRTLKTAQTRKAMGLTSGQVVGGTLAGVGAMRRGDSFRSGYQASSGTKGMNAAYDESTAFMENNQAFKSLAGNDDQLWAFRNGNNMQEVRNILAGRGYAGTDLDQAAQTVMTAKNQVGNRAGQLAAVRMQAKTGTGYEDNAHMLQDIITATGGDMGTASRMLAEMRGSATQSGRMELGTSSFNTQTTAMADIRDAMSSGNAGQVAASLQNANQSVMRSVVDSNGGAAAVHGKPGSATAIARAHREKIADFMDSMSTGRVTDVNGVQRVADARDVKQAFATAHGVHDALRSASPQNARAYADELMCSRINVNALSPEAQAALGPSFATQNSGGGGNGPNGNLTVRQVMENLAGSDQTYSEIRQDFANTGPAAQAAQQQQQQQQAGQRYQSGPPAAPGGTPGATPGS